MRRTVFSSRNCGTVTTHDVVPANALGHAHIRCDGLTQVRIAGFQNRMFGDFIVALRLCGGAAMLSRIDWTLGRFGDRRLDKGGRPSSDAWSRARMSACGGFPREIVRLEVRFNRFLGNAKVTTGAHHRKLEREHGCGGQMAAMCWRSRTPARSTSTPRHNAGADSGRSARATSRRAAASDAGGGCG